MRLKLRAILLSTKANRAFLFASWATLAGLTAVIYVQVFIEEGRVYDTASTLQAVIFYAIVALVSAVVAAQFFLWFGMLLFAAFVTNRTFGGKILLLLPQIFFASVGAALVYLFAYRTEFNVRGNAQVS